LLRGEVLRGAHDHVRAGLLGVAGDGSGDPEVGDHGVTVLVEEDVIGLYVSMDHAFAVGEAQSARNIDRHANQHRLGEGRHDAQPVGQSLGEVVHGEVDRALFFADGKDVYDVGMPELGGRRCLPAESLLERLVTRVLGLQNLEGDRDLELGVERLVDPREAARADNCVDSVLPEGLAEVAFRQSRSLYRVRSSQ
jgi:hypothetical protein